MTEQSHQERIAELERLWEDLAFLNRDLGTERAAKSTPQAVRELALTDAEILAYFGRHSSSGNDSGNAQSLESLIGHAIDAALTEYYETLKLLASAVKAHVDEHGAGGYLLARLSDAERLLLKNEVTSCDK